MTELHRGRAGPPRLAAWLLRITVRDQAASDGILGDLLEEHEADRGATTRARIRLWLAILGVSARFLFLPRAKARQPTSSSVAVSTGRGSAIELFAQSLRYALRGSRRNPGFALSVVAVLGLGMGANTVVFGAVDRLLISAPPHVRDARDVRLVYIRRRAPNGELAASRTISYPDYQDLLAVGGFNDVAVYADPLEFTLEQGVAAHKVRVVMHSTNLLTLLGVEPALGRVFPEVGENESDGMDSIVGSVAVLSYEYWRRRYGSDPNVLGRRIRADDARFGVSGPTIIGVAPPGFTGAELGPVDVWIPTVRTQYEQMLDGCFTTRGCRIFRAVARLAPGATDEAASDEATARHLAGYAEEIARDRYDGSSEVILAPLIAARGPSPMAEAQVLRWVAGVSLAVLLIACLNVINLLLARSIGRQRETTVRLALGAGRLRLVCERWVESTLLTALGAGAALLVAWTLGESVHRLLLPDVAFDGGEVGGRLLVFTALLTLVGGLATGVLPATRGVVGNLADGLRTGGGGSTRPGSRTRTALLLAQAALSVVLLVGAGLFVRSLRAAQELDLGFDARSVVEVRLEWQRGVPATERQAGFERALEGVRRLPGVHSAGQAGFLPLATSFAIQPLGVPGIDSLPPYPGGGPWVYRVGSGYFEAMGLAILRGRSFERSDDAEDARPVTVVSRSMARAIWPNAEAVGSCLLIGSSEEGAPCTEVVGVVEDHRRRELVEDEPRLMYYLNSAHSVVDAYPALRGPPGVFVVGTSGDPRDILDLIRAEAASASPRLGFVDAAPLSDRLEPQIRSWKLGAALFTGFGLLALLVAGWGLYGVLAFDVALRQRELGVRSALGAHAGSLVGMVLRRSVLLMAAGVTAGGLIALGASPFVEPLLFRVSGTDPTTYAVVAVALLTVSLVAGWLPARNATRVDPITALRAD